MIKWKAGDGLVDREYRGYVNDWEACKIYYGRSSYGDLCWMIDGDTLHRTTCGQIPKIEEFKKEAERMVSEWLERAGLEVVMNDKRLPVTKLRMPMPPCKPPKVEMNKICKNCKHWEEVSKQHPCNPVGFGVCDKLLNSPLIMIGKSYRHHLIINENFGCIHWKPKPISWKYPPGA